MFSSSLTLRRKIQPLEIELQPQRMAESYSQDGNPNSWDNNYAMQIALTSTWYRATDLAAALIEIKRMPIHTTQGKQAALGALNARGRTLAEMGVANNHRFPHGALEWYVCEEYSSWNVEMSGLRSALTVTDRQGELAAQGGSASNSRASQDSIYSAQKLILEMLSQLKNRSSLIGQAEFEQYYLLTWG